MPPEKRTKTGKGRSGRKAKNRSKGAPILKKRPPTPLLVAWVLALFFLVFLLYFARQSRQLPELPATLPPLKTAKSAVGHVAPREDMINPAVKKRPQARSLAHFAEQPGKKAGGLSSPSERSAELPARRHLPHLASIPNVRPTPRPEGTPYPNISPKPAPVKVSIVIDDLGPNIEIARQFASLPFPVTLSVLPFQAHSSQIANMAHREGREVILHLPMEPLSSRENPGRGAVLVSMSPGEIRRNVRAALDTSPFFDGVNNHMGSLVTQNTRVMKTILFQLKERGLFFIDSMTTSKSKGWKVARQMRVPTFRRDIFLDDNLSADAIRSQIAKVVKIAKIRGAALAIGHPHEVTLRSLQGAAAYFRKEGVEIVAVHDLVSSETKVAGKRYPPWK